MGSPWDDLYWKAEASSGDGGGVSLFSLVFGGFFWFWCFSGVLVLDSCSGIVFKRLAIAG